MNFSIEFNAAICFSKFPLLLFRFNSEMKSSDNLRISWDFGTRILVLIICAIISLLSFSKSVIMSFAKFTLTSRYLLIFYLIRMRCSYIFTYCILRIEMFEKMDPIHKLIKSFQQKRLCIMQKMLK
jgi:hypothetical protein